MTEFYPHQIFTDDYPEEAADFCNNSDGKYFICEIEPDGEGHRRFQIQETPAPDIEEVRKSKFEENDTACHNARFNQHLLINVEGIGDVLFYTNAQTQADLQSALIILQSGADKYPWVDEAGFAFDFTSESQIQYVLNVFMDKSNVYEKWAYFNDLITNAQTLEDLRAIIIDYTIKV